MHTRFSNGIGTIMPAPIVHRLNLFVLVPCRYNLQGMLIILASCIPNKTIGDPLRPMVDEDICLANRL